MIALRLPMPPTGNQMFTVARGRKIMGANYRKWRQAAEPEIRRQMQGKSGLVGPYRLSLRFDRSSRAIRDLSNYIKGPEDAIVLCGCVRDDSDCVALYAEWTDKAPGKDAEVHILLVDATEAA